MGELNSYRFYYQKINELHYEKIGRGAIWSDAGNIVDLNDLSNFVSSIEKVQNIKIACIDEIAFAQGWIDKKQLKKNIGFYGNCHYSQYLKTF